MSKQGKQMNKQGKQNTNSTDFRTASDRRECWQCAHYFRTVWKVKAGDMIKFNTEGLYTIDWGDGIVEKVKDNDKELKHTYVKKGEYTVAIGPGVTRFRLCQSTAEKLIEIKQWGAAQWKSTHGMFDRAQNMICTATDTPDTSKVENMVAMFRDCKKFNSPIEHWHTKRVKDMRYMLSRARMFNRSLAKMDLRNVVNTFHMLNDTPAFDQDLRDLNIGAKVDTRDMFGYDKSLAQYNEEHGERFDAQDEKQDLYSVLDGAGACRML